MSKLRGFSVFVLVLYEKLLVFCYRCGRIGHGEGNCSFVGSQSRPGSHVPFGLVDSEQVQEEPEMMIDEVDKGQEGSSDDHTGALPPLEPENEFGPWLKPRKRLVASRG